MSFGEKDLVRIAKREKNKKRGYLVVDPLQGKHVPVSPGKALNLFELLAHELDGKYDGERILFVGFAETATAIGAQVAISHAMPYIQTTREIIPGVEYLFFSEAHSHATEQKLVRDDMDAVIDNIDRIIFVEDEVTTGNTILNIIDLLCKNYDKKLRFSVASLLNGMTEESLKIYEGRDIRLHYLLKTDHSKYDSIADTYLGDGKYYPADKSVVKDMSVININGCVNTRRITDSVKYQRACHDLADEIVKKSSLRQDARVLILGTEEFMYPALYVGKVMEEQGITVSCHSTTRSPITTSMEEAYPLHVRYELCSLYDRDRRTFLYDLDAYDYVLVITDAELNEQEGLYSLVNAVKRGNKNITVFRWC